MIKYISKHPNHWGGVNYITPPNGGVYNAKYDCSKFIKITTSEI